jgi:hypothetical protein
VALIDVEFVGSAHGQSDARQEQVRGVGDWGCDEKPFDKPFAHFKTLQAISVGPQRPVDCCTEIDARWYCVQQTGGDSADFAGDSGVAFSGSAVAVVAAALVRL